MSGQPDVYHLPFAKHATLNPLMSCSDSQLFTKVVGTALSFFGDKSLVGNCSLDFQKLVNAEPTNP